MLIGIFAFVIVGIFLLNVGFVSAASSSGACQIGVALVNQDPYPAVPGDYVKIVFQLTGVDNPDCGKITFAVNGVFPFSLDPGVPKEFVVRSGIYSKDFPSFYLAPFKLRVDKDALDGDNVLSASYSTSVGANDLVFEKDFNISVQDLRGDFEVSVKDYDSSTNTISFDILNVGENNVGALTVDVPKQDNFAVKGSSRNIVGSLDANEDTSFSFEGIPKDGDINLKISYTDKINVRREIDKTVHFDSSYFRGRVKDQQKTSYWWYVGGIVVVVGVIWWFRRRAKKRKEKAMNHHKER